MNGKKSRRSEIYWHLAGIIGMVFVIGLLSMVIRNELSYIAEAQCRVLSCDIATTMCYGGKKFCPEIHATYQLKLHGHREITREITAVQEMPLCPPVDSKITCRYVTSDIERTLTTKEIETSPVPICLLAFTILGLILMFISLIAECCVHYEMVGDRERTETDV